MVRRHPETGERHLDALRWGLVPRWAKDLSVGMRMINARGESVAGKPAFRDAFRRRRCIVPVDGFYEWRQGAPKEPKQPYTAALRSGAPMALAGLWGAWRGPGDGIVRTFTVITTDACERLRPLHDRMPVILPREDWPLWLGETVAPEPQELLRLIRPYPGETLSIWPVDRRVVRVSENDAYLVAGDPLASPPPELDDLPPLL